MRKLLGKLIVALRLRKVVSERTLPLPEPTPELRGRLPSKDEDSDSIIAEVELMPGITMRVFRTATQKWEDV